MPLRRLLLLSLPVAAALYGASACSSAKPDVGSAPTASASTGQGGIAFDAGSVPPDAGYDYDAESCYAQPGLQDAFAPVAVQPIVSHVCSAQQIEDFVHSCFGTDTSFCSTWTKDPANAECFAGCLVSPYGTTATPGGSPVPAASWGPVIDVANPGNSTWFNVSACIALADPTKSQCATDLSARFQCEIAVCSPICPVPPVIEVPDSGYYYNNPLTDFQNCVQTADYNDCSTYANAVSTSCTLSEPDAGPAGFCFGVSSSPTGLPALTQLLTLQCGK